MYDDRCSPEFINGVHTFLRAAEANKRADGFMPCPCAGYKNGHSYSKLKIIHIHLFESGFIIVGHETGLKQVDMNGS